MRRIYTAAEMRRAEQWAVNQGASFEELMENAGQGVAKDLLKRINDGKLAKPHCVLIICGKGNNAGDGLVIARVLAEHSISVKLLAQLNLDRLEPFNIECSDDADESLFNDEVDWIIDAVFGTGYIGELPEHVARVMALANQAEAYRITLDVSTGLNCDSGQLAEHTFDADLCYAFAAYKPAHFMPNGKSKSGEIICLDIGV